MKNLKVRETAATILAVLGCKPTVMNKLLELWIRVACERRLTKR